MGRESEMGSWSKKCCWFVLWSFASSSPTDTTMPPVERDGSRLASGEEVEAEEGTGFLFTASVLGTVILGRVFVACGVGLGGSGEEMSSREGRPRFIILFHFSGESGCRAHCSPLSAIFVYCLLKRGESPNAAVIGGEILRNESN